MAAREVARQAEIAVIYFACHGTQHTIGHDEEGYLLPYDVDPDNVVIQAWRWVKSPT